MAAKLLLGIQNEDDIEYEDEKQLRQRKRTLFFDESAENDDMLKGREKFIIESLNDVCDKLILEL